MEEKLPAPQLPWYQQPLWLGLLALALILGGWKLSTYGPSPARSAEQSALLDEVRQMADEELREKLNHYDRPSMHETPYQLPGRLVFFAGLALFVLAGVKMYRQPPVPTPPVSADAAPPE